MLVGIGDNFGGIDRLVRYSFLADDGKYYPFVFRPSDCINIPNTNDSICFFRDKDWNFRNTVLDALETEDRDVIAEVILGVRLDFTELAISLRSKEICTQGKRHALDIILTVGIDRFNREEAVRTPDGALRSKSGCACEADDVYKIFKLVPYEDFSGRYFGFIRKEFYSYRDNQ